MEIEQGLGHVMMTAQSNNYSHTLATGAKGSINNTKNASLKLFEHTGDGAAYPSK